MRYFDLNFYNSKDYFYNKIQFYDVSIQQIPIIIKKGYSFKIKQRILKITLFQKNFIILGKMDILEAIVQTRRNALKQDQENVITVGKRVILAVIVQTLKKTKDKILKTMIIVLCQT